MIESFEEINLREDGILEILIVCKSCEVDLLDGYFFFALALHTFVDLPVDSLSQTLRSLVRVVANYLYHHLTHLF